MMLCRIHPVCVCGMCEVCVCVCVCVSVFVSYHDAYVVCVSVCVSYHDAYVCICRPNNATSYTSSMCVML